MKHTYQALLHLYPYDYRASFAKEMIAAFEQTAVDRRAQGFSAFFHFWLAELVALAIGAPAEWIAKWATAKMVRARALPDLRMMRPAGVSREAFFASPTN